MGYGFLTVFHSIECKIARRHSWQSEEVSSWTYFEEWATPKKWADKWADVSPQPTHLSASLTPEIGPEYIPELAAAAARTSQICWRFSGVKTPCSPAGQSPVGM